MQSLGSYFRISQFLLSNNAIRSPLTKASDQANGAITGSGIEHL